MLKALQTVQAEAQERHDAAVARGQNPLPGKIVGVCVGQGEAMGMLNGAEGVVCVGWKAGEELAAVVASCDVMVAPSEVNFKKKISCVLGEGVSSACFFCAQQMDSRELTHAVEVMLHSCDVFFAPVPVFLLILTHSRKLTPAVITFDSCDIFFVSVLRFFFFLDGLSRALKRWKSCWTYLFRIFMSRISTCFLALSSCLREERTAVETSTG